MTTKGERFIDEEKIKNFFSVDDLVEVEPRTPRDFARIRETLTRLGTQEGRNTLHQLCHILAKEDKETGNKRYYIVHLNELRKLDGEEVDVSEGDIARRNLIANLLEEWNLLNIVDISKVRFPVAALNKVRVIPWKEKENWNLKCAVHVGKFSKEDEDFNGNR